MCISHQLFLAALNYYVLILKSGHSITKNNAYIMIAWIASSTEMIFTLFISSVRSSNI